MKWWAVALLLAISHAGVAAERRVRHVHVTGDEIVVVKTAMGVATIIQVPEKPNSVVVGDLEGFKIEYLDQAVTIKPLHSRAKSNLYIYTDWRRFNAQLVTGNEAEADYVVYLENADVVSERRDGKARSIAPGMRWMTYRRQMKSNEFLFRITRLGERTDGILLLEFVIAAERAVTIKPEWFWLTQGKRTKPIQALFLSKVELRPGDSIQGMLQILKPDIVPSSPLRLEIRRKATSFITIPEVTSWKG